MSKNIDNRRLEEQALKDAQGGNNTSGFKGDGDAATNASKGSSTRNAKRSRKQNPLYIVMRKQHVLYAAFDESMQNTKTKRATLNMAVRLCSKYYTDSFRFWQDLLDEANVLLDSKRFERDCKAKGLDPQAVAEHLVCEGKSTVNKVLKLGLESYGEKARMFSERLYVDTRKLYSNSANEAIDPEGDSSSEEEQIA